MSQTIFLKQGTTTKQNAKYISNALVNICKTLLQETLARHLCKALTLRDLVRHSFITLLQGTLVAWRFCMTPEGYPHRHTILHILHRITIPPHPATQHAPCDALHATPRSTNCNKPHDSPHHAIRTHHSPPPRKIVLLVLSKVQKHRVNYGEASWQTGGIGICAPWHPCNCVASTTEVFDVFADQPWTSQKVWQDQCLCAPLASIPAPQECTHFFSRNSFCRVVW